MRSSPLLAALLCLGAPGAFAQKTAPKLTSDWQRFPKNMVALTKSTEAIFKTFRNVSLEVHLDLTCPYKGDPTNRGNGQFKMMSYFWSPAKFQMEYLVYGSIPTTEYLLSDGLGHMIRRGYTVGKNPRIPPLFNVASDADLVEAWPYTFPRFLLSPFASGKATLSRYVAALVRGVGGYRTETEARQIMVKAGNGVRPFVQYRLLATRPARGKLLESQVEMIFNDGLFLPVRIQTRLGPKSNPKYQLNWTGNWSNKVAAKDMPKNPFSINPPKTGG